MPITRDVAAAKVLYYVREYSDEQNVAETYKLSEAPLSMDAQAIVQLSMMLTQFVAGHKTGASVTSNEISSLTVGKIIDLVKSKCE